MVDPPHKRPLRFDESFDLEAQIVEKSGVIFPECLFVVADVGVEAYPFEEGQAEPGLQPGSYAKAPGEFAKSLWRCVSEGNILIELSSRLFCCIVNEGIGVEFQGEGPCTQ